MNAREGWRWITASASIVLLAVPFLIVRFPPITDLPQLVAQLRLFEEALGRPDSPYAIHWWHPNRLSYLVLALGWLLGGPEGAGRWAMVLLGALWALAFHGLARRRGASAASATLASGFFFNHSLYWGFLNFLIGVPAFVLWLIWTDEREHQPIQRWWRLALGSLLLYEAHILWFGAGVAWLALRGLLRRASLRQLATDVSTVIPMVAMAAYWFAGLRRGPFRSETLWGTLPHERISFEWWREAALGGLRGSAETIWFLAVLGWIAIGLMQSRRFLRARTDMRLVQAAVPLLVLGMVLPEKHSNTIYFASRWVPAAMACLVVGLPAPRWRRGLKGVAAVGLLGALSAATSAAWFGVAATDLDGLGRAFAALPENQRVLGLDFVNESEWIDGPRFYHVVAYAQALKGGELGFSFASLATSLVTYRKLPHTIEWTPHLEYFPERVRRADLLHFDYVLIGGRGAVHEVFDDGRPLTAVTREGTWRLYRVSRGLPRAGSLDVELQGRPEGQQE